MAWYKIILALTVLAWTAATAQRAAAQESPPLTDDALAAAQKYVAEHGDRYMDHHKLSRGMKGYGLTVMAGTELTRFEVEIVSVVTNSRPCQDEIIAKLSGLGLEKSGVLAGMSGSPCYVIDPEDGKEKMIGAVAFGWSFPKEPLCGIQPITQMLAAGGIINPIDATSKPASTPSTTQADSEASPSTHATKEYLAMAMDITGKDFVKLMLGTRQGRAGLSSARPAGPAMVPLATPLMVSGGDIGEFSGVLKAMNMVAVQAGGVSTATATATSTSAGLQPGSAVAVSLVSGDADVSAVGTVTEVIGDRVLAFGHAFEGFGSIDFPMNPAYIHAIVSSMDESFKLGSALPAVGAVISDEQVGIVGVLGKQADVLPIAINVFWKAENRRQSYHYNVIRHDMLTPLALSFAIRSAQEGWKSLPDYCTVHHKGEIEFEGLGKIAIEDVAGSDDLMESTIQFARPIMALAENPFARPIKAKSVTMDFTIEPGSRTAQIMSIRLDGSVYKPGDTISGTVTLRPFRQADKTIPIRFELPATLPDGKYHINACNALDGLVHKKQMMPHLFEPRSTQELFQALSMIAACRSDQLCLYVPIAGGGMAIGQNELPHLPKSKAVILDEAHLSDASNYQDVLQTQLDSDFALTGQAQCEFTVQQTPNQTLLRN
jgi:hypothetical protein